MGDENHPSPGKANTCLLAWNDEFRSSIQSQECTSSVRSIGECPGADPCPARRACHRPLGLWGREGPLERGTPVVFSASFFEVDAPAAWFFACLLLWIVFSR